MHESDSPQGTTRRTLGAAFAAGLLLGAPAVGAPAAPPQDAPVPGVPSRVPS